MGPFLRSALIAVLVAAGLAVPGTALADGHERPFWKSRPTGSTAEFRGLAAVDGPVAWVGGSDGVVLRTVDGGRSWKTVSPPHAGKLLFRDVEAFDARHAVVLAIGEGDASRVFVTSDGGARWSETFRNPDPKAFYDCMSFYDRRHGLAVSDPVNGRFRIIATSDGGRSWRVRPAAGMPAALPGEAAFAASGTCLVTAGHEAYLASGGGAVSRVYRSGDFGRTWRVSRTPVASGPTAGIFSLAFRDPQHGLAIGGDFLDPTRAPHALAVTGDGARSWQAVKHRAPGDYRSGAAFTGVGNSALAVGPTGSNYSGNGGRTWVPFDTGSFDAVSCAAKACWASGIDGRVAVLRGQP